MRSPAAKIYVKSRALLTSTLYTDEGLVFRSGGFTHEKQPAVITGHVIIWTGFDTQTTQQRNESAIMVYDSERNINIFIKLLKSVDSNFICTSLQ
jgi:hypothetical protein